jgi:hypothetical protein
MIIVGCIFVLLGIFIFINVCFNDDIAIFKGSFYGMCYMLSIMIGISMIINKTELEIKPIDVYRGKTSLEITYRDSIAIDTVVVWKK